MKIPAISPLIETFLGLALLSWTSSCVAATLTFHTSPPVPDADDIYNFVGGSRDGLNVNDDNGLDGPLNDNFTYVANDRPRQGQTFAIGGGTQTYNVKAIWIRMVGYTNNGTAPEPGYSGTNMDLSAGGTFRIRLLTSIFPSSTLLVKSTQTYTLTGSELNNPAPGGLTTTTNGAGVWLKFVFDGRTGFAPNALGAIDLTSIGVANRQFEWLGTSSDVFANGTAYNGNQLGLGSSSGELTRNLLAGDRVFMVELELAPEPASGRLAGVLGIACLSWRRRR